ncbi:MAG: DUF2339 domain-containing protein [Thauera sp.]|nr:DUF2339 domain-containing protein [Thauera sp.]
MKLVIWIILGAALGLMEGAAGAIVGAVLGGMVASLLRERGEAAARVDARIAALEQQVVALGQRLATRGDGASSASATVADNAAGMALAPDTAPVATSTAATPAQPARLDESVGTSRARTAPRDLAGSTAPTTTDAGIATEAAASDLRSPIDLDALYARWRDWLFGGNTLVRVGILVLFFGLAFLARYAVEHALLPPALRVAGFALTGYALGALGWRLRLQRRGYALTLQGGGIAVLYLTAFAALRLYGLMSAEAAFAAMLALVCVAAWLAVRQEAPVLAIIGTAGGFAAPILASTGAGDHVQLFTYYAILNAGVLLLAWRKAWRGLNLTGFLFTFVIGLAWGARFYHPWHYASTEPFLILFALMYVAAAVAYAWKRAPALRDPVDGTLVFGVPVVGFGLQAALVQGMPYALAWSAAAAGAFYLALAALLRRLRQPRLELLVASFAALGIAFLTLALPLAFDGRWSAAAWALEGAALWWVGLRQARRLAAGAGLLLQAGAGLLFAADLMQNDIPRTLPLLNSAFLGTAMIAAAGFASARFAARPDSACRMSSLRNRSGPALLAWAWLWWLGGAWDEIAAQLTTGMQPAALLLSFAASGALAAAIGARLRWSALQQAAQLPLAGAVVALAQSVGYGVPPSANGGWLAWPAGVALHLFALRFAERDLATLRRFAIAHAAGVWVAALALSQELGLRLAAWPLGEGWKLGAFALPPALLLAALALGARSTAWPLRHWHASYLVGGAAPVAVALVLWAAAIHPFGAGAPDPLGYLPLLNPMDLSLALALGAVALWLERTGGELVRHCGPLIRLQAVLALAAFIAADAALLRAVHHYTGTRWDLSALLALDTTQAALSLFWALLGLGLMLAASRRASRMMWLTGAGLMVAVVGKLFLVDMAASGALARIVSFIGAGLLLLVVGYFSPLPPKREDATATG